MKSSKEKSLAELKAMPDKAIDYSDIPELDANFWRGAKIRVPAKKQLLSLRLDEDVVEWFKAQGKGYQSLMNAVLKSYASRAGGEAA